MGLVNREQKKHEEDEVSYWLTPERVRDKARDYEIPVQTEETSETSVTSESTVLQSSAIRS